MCTEEDSKPIYLLGVEAVKDFEKIKMELTLNFEYSKEEFWGYGSELKLGTELINHLTVYALTGIRGRHLYDEDDFMGFGYRAEVELGILN